MGWEGGRGQAIGWQSLCLQQGPCLGGSHIITSFCCVKDCPSWEAPPDPHSIFPWEQWCRKKVSRCGATLWGNSVLDSPARWPETHGGVSLGQQHPEVSLAGFFEVRALIFQCCRKGRGAPGSGGQCSGRGGFLRARREEEMQGRGCTQATAHLPPETPAWVICDPACLFASPTGEPGVLLNPAGIPWHSFLL